MVSQKAIDELPARETLTDKTKGRRYIENVLKAFAGKSVFFDYNGNKAEAYLTSIGVDHSNGPYPSPERALIFSTFYDLVKKAEYSYSTIHDSHNAKADNIPGDKLWDCFIAIAEIAGEKYRVCFKIRTIDSDVRSQIYHIATKTEADSSRDHGLSDDQQDEVSSYGGKPASEIRVSPKDRTVKSQLSFSPADDSGRELTQEQRKKRHPDWVTRIRYLWRMMLLLMIIFQGMLRKVNLKSV